MRKLAPILLMTVALAACVAPPLPEDHYYRLELAPPPAPSAAPLVSSINVERIRMTGVYGERPLLHSSTQAPTELRQYHYHYWADNPARLIQEQLADYLRAAQLARAVSARNGAAAAYQVSGTVRRFEQRLGGNGTPARAEVVLELVVQRATDSAPLLSKTYSASVPAGNDSPLAAAQALSQGLTQCFAAFTADVRLRGLPEMAPLERP